MAFNDRVLAQVRALPDVEQAGFITGLPMAVGGIGLRMALGATPGAIVGLIVRRGLALAAAGALIGTAGAYGVGRSLEALLGGVSPHAPLVYAAAAGVASLLALTGTMVPALRASRISPLEAARE